VLPTSPLDHVASLNILRDVPCVLLNLAAFLSFPCASIDNLSQNQDGRTPSVTHNPRGGVTSILLTVCLPADSMDLGILLV
jgi:hypothetical protein